MYVLTDVNTNQGTYVCAVLSRLYHSCTVEPYLKISFVMEQLFVKPKELNPVLLYVYVCTVCLCNTTKWSQLHYI